MAIKVFISHKQEDEVKAKEIGAYLVRNGLDIYLDSIDKQLEKSGPDLADYIRTQLASCTQLLAVLTPMTKASWWVPWEIGVATEKERFLASFVSPSATVPEFLQKWPYLRTQSDLDKYITESKRAQQVIVTRTQKGEGIAAKSEGFRSFHNNLRASLGQR